MGNIFVYCELTEEGTIADVSLELLSKGRKLADNLNCKLEAIVIGNNIDGIDNTIYPYGTDVVHVAESENLSPYTTLPHAALVSAIFKEEQPEVALFGAGVWSRPGRGYAYYRRTAILL